MRIEDQCGRPPGRRGFRVPGIQCAGGSGNPGVRRSQMPRSDLFPNPSCALSGDEPRSLRALSRIPRSMIAVDQNLSGLVPKGSQKSLSSVRHVAVWLPYIGRGTWGSISTVLRSHERRESRSPPSQVSLARSGTGNGNRIPETGRVEDSPRRRACGTDGTHHPDCRSLGKPKKCMLQICAAIRREVRASLSAVDQARATETSRSDRGAFA